MPGPRTVRFNEEEEEILEEAKRIWRVKGHHGGDSKAIKKSLEFFVNFHSKAEDKFDRNFGESEKEYLREKL